MSVRNVIDHLTREGYDASELPCAETIRKLMLGLGYEFGSCACARSVDVE